MAADTHKIGNNPDDVVKKWPLPSMGVSDEDVFNHKHESLPETEQESPAIPTAEEIENWHKQAHAEGYQQGLKQAEQETSKLRQRLTGLINFFESPLQSLNDEVEQQLHLLAVTLAQQLVRREIRAEPGEIIALIRESIKLLPASSRKIRIYLNPEDAELVRNTLQLDQHEDEESWKLVEDPMITRGGCEIKSDNSVINVTLENRLQALAASMLGGERSEDQDVPGSD